ncbi:hypothetical protein N9Y17_02185 [Gammaproteobacteria bacterium]|nr:hypothetical protein [Gammaproteobacteria bacterium]
MTSSMPANLGEWLKQIEQVCRKNQTNKQSDSDIKKAYQLANLTIKSKVVLVAGTNGKGTTIALLQAYFHALGRRVLSYTSPHLMRFEERIFLDNQPLSAPTWCQLFHQVDQLVKVYQLDLSYFEWITMASFFAIEKFQPDIALMEIGLGGRKDAVNVLPSNVSIITKIDLDHTELLGATRGEIAAEKSGVMRAGRYCLIGDEDPPQTIVQCAEQSQAKLLCAGIDFLISQNTVKYQDYIVQDIPMQLAPASVGCALVAIDHLKDLGQLNIKIFQMIIGKLTLPGRLEVINKNQQTYLFDVAHNPASCQRLAEFILQLKKIGDHLIVFNCKANKAIRGCLAPLVSSATSFAYLSINEPGMAQFEQVEREIKSLNPHCNLMCITVDQLEDVCRSKDFIVVYGSFLTVAVVKHQMNLV